MARSVTEKILQEHLAGGELTPGGEIALRIDQTLTQDATGTTAFLLFEATGIPRVRTELSVSYVDHNMAQFGPENHNDHLYLQSIAPKVGAYHSRPGNGICHQVHLERFARPGATLLGSDSHTPTGGGMGMIAIGAGGLDVAVAMGGGAFYLTCPRVIGVELRGRLRPWVAAKDVILRLLSILTTKGNVGCVVEYYGPGVAELPVPARATCTNMGAELGVTTSVFPADGVTRQFLDAQGRGEQFSPITADADASYDRITKRMHVQRDAEAIENLKAYATGVKVSEPDEHGNVEVSFEKIVLDLDRLEPLAAAPGSPGNVIPVAELEDTAVQQVVIGSCTNSSYQDLTMAAAVLKGRTVHPGVELGIAPGSKQVLSMLARSGALANLVASGARVLESACGPCIGLGFSPGNDAVSVRTFNRNFTGRSGTPNDKCYLVSPETALAAALAGRFVPPQKLAEQMGIQYPRVDAPEHFPTDDNLIIPPMPEAQAAKAEVVRGPTIVKPPRGETLPEPIRGKTLIKVGDKVTTDHIMPAGRLLKLRSNVPEYARYVFSHFQDEGETTFAERALALKEKRVAGVIVAGDSYGQGSSREHAALCPMYLGVRAVVAKAIERIHQANLVNFAILPLTGLDDEDYDRIDPGDGLVIRDVDEAIASADRVTVRNTTKGFEFTCDLALAPRQRKILRAAGLLNYTRQAAQ